MEIKEYANSSKLFDGHFRLLRPLSTDGGTADVWLAIDTNTIDSLSEDEDNTDVNDSGMLVAIKFIVQRMLWILMVNNGSEMNIK